MKKVFSETSVVSEPAPDHDPGVNKKGFTAECAENPEKKMASINHMKFGFSEPAPAGDQGICTERHLART